MNNIKQYFKESIQEFNNVTWPTKKQAVRISAIVLIVMMISAIVLGFVDFLLSEGYQALLHIK